MNSNNFMQVRVQKKNFFSSSSSSASFEFAALPHLRFIRKEQKKFLWKFSSEQKHGHHIRRSPIFRPKSESEEQKIRS